MRKLRLQNNRSVESLNVILVANDFFSQDRDLNSRLLRRNSQAPDSRAIVAYFWERDFVDSENDSSQRQIFTAIGHLELRWLILDLAPKWAHRRAQSSKKAAAQGHGRLAILHWESASRGPNIRPTQVPRNYDVSMT
jgi:hypothetical protein